MERDEAPAPLNDQSNTADQTDQPEATGVEQLEHALGARRRARRQRAVLALVAAFSALLGAATPHPTDWVLYAVAVISGIVAVVFIVRSGRAKRSAAALAVDIHELNPQLDVLQTLPKPVAKAARRILARRTE